ncbi:MAG: hypothetical protein J2P55_02070 [Rhizobiales bacterium]|nr:hypothetical protein [Hyphomicrobiales bacterium]
MRQIEEPFGPAYNVDSAALRKFRAKARRGAPYDPAYAEAVERAVLARQRIEAGIGLPAVNPKCHCASGTAHNDGREIHKAVQRQQAAALEAYPAQIRRARTPQQWRTMYAEAMADKAKRRAAACGPGIIVIATNKKRGTKNV